MNSTRPVVLLLHHDRLLREHLRKASRPEFDVCVVQCWDELLQVAQRASWFVITIVDPYCRHYPRSDLAPALWTIRQSLPSLIVIAAIDRDAARLEDVHALGQLGVGALLLLGRELSVEAVRERLLAARMLMLQRAVSLVHPIAASGLTRRLLEAAVEVAAGGGQAERLAAALHVSHRTLTRRCLKAGLPAPRRLLAWMRVLIASSLLDDPGRTVSGVAFACGYYSDTTLRRALQTFLEMSPSDLRERGSLTTAVRMFRDELRETSGYPRRAEEAARTRSTNSREPSVKRQFLALESE
jgi:AraC-like DNA-binding protein